MSTNTPSDNPEKNTPRKNYLDQIFMIANYFGEKGATSFQIICSKLQSEEPKILALLENGINPFENVIKIVQSQKETMTPERAASFCLIEINRASKTAEEEKRKNDLAEVISEEISRGTRNAIKVAGIDNISSGIVKNPGLDIYDNTTDGKMVPWVTFFGSQDEVNKDYRHATNAQKIAAADRDSQTGQAVNVRNNLKSFTKSQD